MSGKYPLQSGATCLMEGKYCPLYNKLASHILFHLGVGEVKVDHIVYATDSYYFWRHSPAMKIGELMN